MPVYLTQRELEVALDEIVNELDNRNDNIDVVYIPPEVDELTDEEDIDDNVAIEQFRPNEQEISGLFEIQNHNDTSNKGPIDSDDETLDVKRQKLLRQKVSAPVWKKGETTYANLPVFDNTDNTEEKI
ncbi:hypothetical protein QE152_g37563 [Popillia japonica]|uniref:Uncharacterized protein n=1 Tax=Popillia japonica TaxID=7064 RepID=A0AAW1IA75_POPJA